MCIFNTLIGCSNFYLAWQFSLVDNGMTKQNKTKTAITLTTLRAAAGELVQALYADLLPEKRVALYIFI